MQVVILCGGKGTRLREETERRPKPMVEIGGYPILWHIMKIYSHYGYNDFILCLGYKGYIIKDYFLNFKARTGDFTFELFTPDKIQYHNANNENNWRITFAETGESALTGSRIYKIKKYITEKTFMVTYGDGVADVNIERLVDFHFSHGKIATVTGVRPGSRFGEMITSGGQVLKFTEKPQTSTGLINGGFFVFNDTVFDYLQRRDDTPLEGQPMINLVRDAQLMVFSHEGFWQPMDTFREYTQLNKIWETGDPPWKVWKG